MPWVDLVDCLGWAVTLVVSILLARIVYRRRDLPARLFLGVVVTLAIPQAYYFSLAAITFADYFLAGIQPSDVAILQSFWPVAAASLVLFGCLNLHLFLVFPMPSRVLQALRWFPVFLYVTGSLLASMILSHLLLGPFYLQFWGLAGWTSHPLIPQLVFVFVVTTAAMARLVLVYFYRVSPALRRRLTLLLMGLTISGGSVFFAGFLPKILDLPAPLDFWPGLRQLPILILLGAYAVSLQRYYALDPGIVLGRSMVYSGLLVVLTVLYLAIGSLLTAFPQLTWARTDSRLAAMLLTSSLVVLVALPLRDTFQRLADNLFARHQASYRSALQEFSRELAAPLTQARLLAMIADRIEGIFHPVGLAIVLLDDPGRYWTALAHGRLAGHALWRRDSFFPADHFLPARMALDCRLVDVPWFVHEAPQPQKENWERVEDSGVELLIPLHLGTHLVGWLAIGSKLSELPYDRPDREFLSALADQSSVALENARLYGEMQQRATELAMLAMVSSALSSSLDIEQVLETIVESVTKVANCDKSAIFELSPDGQTMSLRMARGMSERYLQSSRHIPVESSSRALSVVTQEPLIVPDIHREPRLASLVPLADQEGYRAVVDLPLASRQGHLGVLSVYFGEVHEPSLVELEVLTTFANQAAIAIENARLYATATGERDRARVLYEQTDAALARRLEELTTVESLSRRLTSTLDLQEVMDLVLEQTLQAAQADRGVISLYDPEVAGLRLLAQAGFPAEMNHFRTEPWPDSWGITGRVARSGMPALIADVQRDPDYVASAPTTRSQLTVPILHEERVSGVITLESDLPAAFTEEHLRFAALLADHAAIGIHNAQIYQQAMEGRDRLQAILNSTRDAVIVFDTTGHCILANPTVCEWFGPTVTRWLRSSSLLDAIQDRHSALYRVTDIDAEKLLTLLNSPKRRREEGVELAFQFRRGKQQRYIEATVAPVLSAVGDIFGWVTVMRDMTHQQDLERFREDLTSMVIHNLQGPLAAVIGSLETLREMQASDESVADRLLTIALESGRKLYSRIGAVLWLRRLEDRQMPLDRRPLPLPGIVEAVMDEYRAMALMSGVSLKASLARNLPRVVIDEEVIGRVFSNLLDNALKYTPARGSIEVCATVENPTDGAYILCSVADTGPGISEQVRKGIFEKFYRGQEGPGRRKGMGIGLHYCKLAIEAHGGRIWVDCPEGLGSRFYFTLPSETGPVYIGETDD